MVGTVRGRGGNVHARDPTRAGGWPAELLQPPHQRVDLRPVRLATARPRSSTPPSSTSLITVAAVALGVLIAFPLALLARRLPAARGRRSSASAPASTRSRRWRCSRCSCRSPASAPTTVVIGLALYALTILVRSMLEGLRAVPDEVRESATGLGYGASRLLFRVELPLALPVIMAGLRVATVSTVALTTVGSLVSYGGLGNLIKDGVDTNFRAELFTAAVLCVVLAVVLDVLLVLAQRLLTPWTRGADDMNLFARHLGLPHRPGQLAGPTAACSSCWSSSCCSASPRSRWPRLIGLPIALWLGHLGRGGFLAINISNVGRAIPTFALLALLVTADWPGTAEFGPYGRAGLATLIALTLFALPPIITNAYVAIREVPDDVKEAADGMGMTGAPAVLPGRASAGAAAGDVRRPAGPRPGVGDRHHRRPGRRAGPRPGHHRRLLPLQLRQGHRRRHRRRGGRAGARAARGRSPAGRRPDTRESTGRRADARHRRCRWGHDWASRAGSGHARPEPRDTEGDAHERTTFLRRGRSPPGSSSSHGCAGDDLAESGSDDAPEASGGGEVRISGQSFPEAALVAAMYEAAADRRRLRHRRSSWSTPATSTWRTVPRDHRRGARVRRRHRRLPQRHGERRRRRAADHARRATSRSPTPQSCSTSRASPCSSRRRPPTPTPSS